MICSDLYVTGTGAWLPTSIPVAEAVADGRYDREEQAVNDYESITVSTELAPPDMAVRAAKQALERSGQADEVAIVLHASAWYQGLDFWPTASYIHREVLAEHDKSAGRYAPALDVAQMSNGGLAALELAASYLQADPSRQAALVTSADRLAEPGFDRWRSDLAGIVYGDGAGALMLSRGEGTHAGFARLVAISTVSDSQLEGMYRGSEPFGLVSGQARQPIDVRARRRAYLAEAGFDSTVDRTSAGLIEALDRGLAEAGSTSDDIARYIFPNVGRNVLVPRYLATLGLDEAKTTWAFGRRTGHVGAADQLITLDHLAAGGTATEVPAPAPGDRIALIGIGAGFSWTCAVLEWVSRPHWAS